MSDMILRALGYPKVKISAPPSRSFGIIEFSKQNYGWARLEILTFVLAIFT